MKHFKITAFDIPDAYIKTISKIYNEGEIFVVKYGSELTETKKLDVTIEISHPENRPLLHEKAPNDQKYLNWYAGIYLWYPEHDDAEYTYGNRMRKPIDQIQEVINRFKEEQMDRQCTIVIRRPEDITKDKCKDPPCLTILDYEIMYGKLNCTAYFRSWDAYAGLPINIAGLQMVNEAIALETGVSTGRFILHSKNCHIYKRTYKLVEDCIGIKENN